ncbi:MAG: flagellar hook-associated protein FlgK [Lachnospira sp.]
MASTFFGLTIAYTGLQASQAAINVTSHNLANINTKGYSREAASTQADRALRTYASYGTIGSGVIVTEITQKRDSYYDDKYRNNETNYGEYEVKENYMAQIESYLNEFVLDGYSEEYINFFSAVNQVMLTPEDESAKNQLINNALSMTDYFNTLGSNLRDIQVDANNEIKDAVEQINSLAQNISSLNKQINQIEAHHGNANDLRDQRNALVDDLSKIVNISTSEQDLGNGLTNYSISLNGSNLVDGYNYFTLEVSAREEQRNASDSLGLYDVKWSSGQPFDIYSNSLGGQLKGLVDIRDGCNGEIESYAVDENGNDILDSQGNYTTMTSAKAAENTSFKGIPYYMSQLNQFMQIFTDAVNQILVGTPNNPTYTSDGQNTGIPLFVTKDKTIAMSATNVTVNPDLLKNASLLATKSRNNTGEANADIIEELYNLQNSKIFDGGTGSFFLESIVSDMSIDSSKANNFLANYNNLQSTIQNQRLSVMGVDIEEEAMDLVKFQQAYNLSSKMMTVMNQLYDKLINYTGV